MKTTAIIFSVILLVVLSAGGFGYAKLERDRNSLQSRVGELEAELQSARDELQSARDALAKGKYAEMLTAIKTGQDILDVAKEIRESTTSLLHDKQKEEFSAKVETLKGRRIALAGTVKDVGKRIISLSQLYLTLETDGGFMVKFIFDKEAKSELLGYKAGDKAVLEGYVISTGDLHHDLTVGGATFVDPVEFGEVLHLAE